MERIYKSIAFRPIETMVCFTVIVISVGLLTTQYYLFAVLLGPLVLFLFFFGRYPQIGYYLIIFLVPFGHFSGFSGSYQGLSIAKVTGIWISIVILFYFLVNKRSTFNIKSNLWPWFLIFFLISIVSTIVSDYKLTSLIELLKIFISYTFFFLTLIFISRKDFLKTLPSIIIWSVSFSSLIGILGYTFNIPFLLSNVDVKRGLGAAVNPNVLCFIIFICLPLLVHKFFVSSSFFEKIITTCLFVLNLTMVFLTFSRSGGILLGLLLFILVIENMRRFKPKHFGFVALPLVIIIIAVILFTPHSYWERIGSITHTKTDTSVSQRATFLYAGWDFLKENPFIGSGPGTFKELYSLTGYALHYAYEDYSNIRFDPHNSYLVVLTGQGLAGILVFLIVILIALKNYNNAKKHFLFNGELEMASLVGAYRAFFITMLFCLLTMNINNHKYVWLAIGLSQVALSLSVGTEEEETDVTTDYSKEQH